VIVKVLVTDPLLREEWSSNKQHEGCGNNCHGPHEYSFHPLVQRAEE
jgi:hypothetical protein